MKYILLIVAGIVILAISLLILFKQKIIANFWISHMETKERLEKLHVNKIIDALQINPDDIIADVGAGSGLFSRKMALKASRGTVYAIDINMHLPTLTV